MRKFHFIGLALLAVFVFSAIAAASAFAESQWLVDNVVVGAGQLVETDTEGLLLLVNSNVPLAGTIEIDCEGILDGNVGPKGEAEVTAVLPPGGGTAIPSFHLSGNDTGYLVEGTGLMCTMEKANSFCGALNALVEVWPKNLPWLSQVELEGTMFLNHLFGLGAGDEPGYDVLCNSTGLSNLCEGLSTALLENDTLEEDVLGFFTLGQNGPLQTCEMGEGDLEGEGLILVTATGHTLQVSDV